MTSNRILSHQRVNNLFLSCLFSTKENNSTHVRVEGVTTTILFDPERIERHRGEIESLLNEIPGEFKMSVGGGSSFLKFNIDKHGNKWTDGLVEIGEIEKEVGEKVQMDQLLMLGIAIDKIGFISNPKSIRSETPFFFIR